MSRSIQKTMPPLVAEWHSQISPMDPVIRNFRITADTGKSNETDHGLTHPPFNDSATALRACAYPRSGATMQLVSAAKDHFRKERAEQVNKLAFA